MTQEEIANYQMGFFVDYKLAKELREKGFDMPCLGFYYSLRFWFNDGFEDGSNQDDYSINSELDKYTFAAPLIDQVIEWLIEKYNMRITQSCEEIHADEGFMWFPSIDIIGKYDTKYYDEIYQTRKEAQLAGIKHALTLIK